MLFRSNQFRCHFAAWFATFLSLLLVPQFALGQLPPLSGLSAPSNDANVVSASATATIDPSSGEGTLKIVAQIKPGWHIYSISQPPPPRKTTIKLDAQSGVEQTGDVRVLTPPAVHREPAFDNVLVEEHVKEAVWEMPIKLKPGTDPNTLKLTGAINAQACSESCLAPANYPFIAKITLGKQAEQPAPASTPEYRAEGSHVVITGRIIPAVAKPGSIAQLVLQAEPDPSWHVYALADRDPQQVAKPTLIALADTTGLRFKHPVADSKPLEEASPVPGDVLRYYEKPVTWTVPLEIPAGSSGEYAISGYIGYQTCTSSRCDTPKAAHFTGRLLVSNDATGSDPVPLAFSPAKYGQVAQLVEGGNGKSTSSTQPQVAQPGDGSPLAKYEVISLNDSSPATLPAMILFGLLGGLILNLMPCVLPVIGLKILGFAEQAHHQRGRILALNVWYAAGMLAVFLVLGTLAAGAKLGISEQNLGWGQQFGNTAFNVSMAAIVFVMALSFLGVWEIPIPGFIGHGKTQELAAREGASGAFAKGVVTTLLATPCSGPFLGPVFGFTLSQSPLVIYVIFIAIGVGMALPYLLIGAFPQLIRWLPKPGVWMDTFKHVMGFVMLGTVAFIFSFMQKDYVVPTFVLLIGLWAACWWIGLVPGYASLGKRFLAWGQGGVFAALVGWFAFTQLTPGHEVIAWQPFSRTELARLSSEGKTVFVDFSADWCATCKLNLKLAVDTDAVAKALEKNGVVPMLADWTDGSEEIKQMLESLGSNSIPVLAIFPADRPGEAFVLRDAVTKSQVLHAIDRAGPSRAPESVAQRGE
jgi:suppressor for copper-sensitivity B